MQKPKTQNNTAKKIAKSPRTSMRMLLPLMILSVSTGLVLVVSSFAGGVYPSGYMNNLYSQAFSRNIDSSGQSYWQAQFSGSGCSGTTLANAAKTIYDSSEFAGKLYNSGEVVNRIYGGALQRNPDTGGYNYWVGQLNGGASRASVATSIINGSQSEINNLAKSACAAPTPTPTPTPSPSPSPSPSPTPAPKPKPRPSGGGSTSSGSNTQPSSADTQAPAKPGNFKAKVDTASSGVTLSWDASTDNVGVAAYRLERSTNGTDWNTLSDTVTDTSYDDRTVIFSTKYQYRLSALDAAGNVSDSATTDITTGAFNANASTDNTTAIASDDNVVLAALPAGAVPDQSSCTVTSDTDNVTDLKAAAIHQLILAGPYLVSCKDSNGDVVASFNKPVTVTMAPPSASTRGNANFRVFVYDMQAGKWVYVKSTYDKKAKTYQVPITGPSQVAFVGQKAANYWPLFLSIFIPLGLFGGGAFWYYNSKLKKQQYADYIKKKYYNL